MQKIFRRIITFFFIGCLLCIHRVNGQNIKQVGTYPALSLEYNLKNKWSLFAETEMRSAKYFERFYYYEVKTGASYSIRKNLKLTAALGFYHNFEEGEAFDYSSKKTEWRIWQQVSVKQNLPFVFPEHRIRIEEVVSNNWKLNIRYRLHIKTPLNKEALEKGTVFLSAFDELFFGTQNKWLTRNRVFGGFGWIIDKKTTIQAGLLRQNDYKSNSRKGKNYLYIGLGLKL